MDSFGLGLVLNFVDNASQGMIGAMATMQKLNSTADSLSAMGSKMQVYQGLSIVGYTLDDIGNRALNASEKMLTFATSAVKGLITVGTEMQGARARLNVLFSKDEGGGEAMLQWTKDYAQKSIFEFKDVLNGALMMKTAMIDVRKEITTTTGSASQTILDYASDLAAFNPQARNLYGTGVQAAMGSLKEYIAEGNAVSLKRGFSLDITEILGQKKGDTAEERTQQVADLIDKLGMVGMTANLAGTPMQRLSNVSDFFYNLLTEISDSGVFEKYTQLVTKLTDAIFDIGADEKSNIAKVLAKSILGALEPLDKFVDMLVIMIEKFRELVKTNPEAIEKGMKSFITFSGILIGGGIVSKVIGTVMKIAGSFGTMSMFIGNAVPAVSGLVGALGGLAPVLAILAGIVAAIIQVKRAFDLVFKKDFMGLGTQLTDRFKELKDTFAITFGFLKNGSVSEEQFKRAQELGILPFITGVLNLQHVIGKFVEAFKKGWDEANERLIKIFETIKVKIPSLTPLLNGIGDILSGIASPESEKVWETLGNIIGQILGTLLSIVPIVGGIAVGFDTVFKAVKKVADWINKIPEYISDIKNKITNVFETLSKNLPLTSKMFGNIFVGLKAHFGNVLKITKSLWTNLFKNIVSVGKFFGALFSVVGSAIYNVWKIIFKVWGFIYQVLRAIKLKVLEVVSGIQKIIQTAIQFLIDTVINPFLGLFGTDLDSLKDTFLTIFGSIGDFVGGVFDGIYDKARKVIDWITNGLLSIKDTMNNIGDWIGNLISGATNVVKASNDEKQKDLVGLSTGGYVKETGIAVLHPNEVVVNDNITGQLKRFLSNPVAKGKEEANSSITFGENSLVVRVEKASEAEAIAFAKKVMVYIDRFKQKQKMSTRRPIGQGV